MCHTYLSQVSAVEGGSEDAEVEVNPTSLNLLSVLSVTTQGRHLPRIPRVRNNPSAADAGCPTSCPAGGRSEGTGYGAGSKARSSSHFLEEYVLSVSVNQHHSSCVCC